VQNLQIIRRLIAQHRRNPQAGAVDAKFMESLNCPKNRRLAKNKINQYQLYELHNLLKLLFVIASIGIVQSGGVCVRLYKLQVNYGLQAHDVKKIYNLFEQYTIVFYRPPASPRPLHTRFSISQALVC
jgi:hypothetical protein